MLAIHAHQRLFEAGGLLFERDELLLGQLDFVAGVLLAVLGLDRGGADGLGRLLLGFLDDVFAQALGVDHGGAQGIFLRAVLVDALGQNDELFLQVLVLGGQGVHAVGDLLEIVVHILAAVAAHGAFKRHAAHVL